MHGERVTAAIDPRIAAEMNIRSVGTRIHADAQPKQALNA
jgi:hypothetical protein